jgi:hypothetical protein
MTYQKLPPPDLIQQLAAFWDQHDLTDFKHSFKEVIEPVFERDTVIMLYLDVDEAKAVQDLAMLQGMDDAELIREWIREKIRDGL